MSSTYICPLTLQPFLEPVVDAEGHTYERSAITQHILHHGKNAKSPMTRNPIALSDLRTNYALVPSMYRISQTPLLDTHEMEKTLEPVADEHGLVHKVQSMDAAVVQEGATAARQMSCDPSQIDMMIATGMVPNIIALLGRHDAPSLQAEATWTLTNMTAGTFLQTQVIVGHGAIEQLIPLILSSNEQVKQNSIWALANIAGDSILHRDAVLRAGILESSVQLFFAHPDMTMMSTRVFVFLLKNLCMYLPYPSLPSLVKAVFPMLEKICKTVKTVKTKYRDAEMIEEMCLSLFYLIKAHSKMISRILNARLVPILVSLLDHSDFSVQNAALACVTEMLSGSVSQTDAVLKAGVLPRFFDSLCK